jgi:amino acid transporter
VTTEAEKPGAPTLSTFLGVYTPSVLTILGVVLFLRTGWMVGNVGLVPALGIVVLAHLITLATALSLSAIATNMRVGGGGAYYMISRSLGLEIGGAIGVPLFLAQTFSVTLYSFGLAEGLRLLWPQLPMAPVAAATVIVVTLLASRSAAVALRAQLPILAALGVALVMLALGVARDPSSSVPLFLAAEEGGESFWIVFAVFFPAVTGLLAGVSLSGDLSEPKRSIPRGTLLAVATGFVVYLAVAVLLAVGADSEALRRETMIWWQVGLLPVLIWPGFLGATVSSAVGSILGGPRTLAALADDRVVPRLPQPRIGRWRLDTPLLISACVALAAVMLGDLNAVAPILTMFFLTTYGVVNLVAGLEQLSGSPSYRPAIRVPWWISLAGAAGCVWVMALINSVAALAAILIELLLYWTLRRRSFNTSFGDLRYGALVSLARASLLRLRTLPMDPRNWRPHILVFTEDLEKRIDLLRFASWLNQDRGILTVCQLFEGDFDELAPTLPGRVSRAHQILEEEGILAFAEAEVVHDLEAGILDVCQANGIAGLSSNALMLGWSRDERRMQAFLRVMRRASALGKSTILCRIAPRGWSARFERIDVWWGGLENNGDMLLLFAYLLTANRQWADARISVKTVASSALSRAETEEALTALLDRSRIRAHSEVIERGDRTVQEIIQERSRDADLVLLGMQEPAEALVHDYLGRLNDLVGELPTVLLLRAAGPYAGQLLGDG